MKITTGASIILPDITGIYEVDIKGSIVIHQFIECSTGYKEGDVFAVRVEGLTKYKELDLNNPKELYTALLLTTIKNTQTKIEYLLFEEDGILFAHLVQFWKREDWGRYLELRNSGFSPRETIEFNNL